MKVRELISELTQEYVDLDALIYVYVYGYGYREVERVRTFNLNGKPMQEIVYGYGHDGEE